MQEEETTVDETAAQKTAIEEVLVEEGAVQKEQAPLQDSGVEAGSELPAEPDTLASEQLQNPDEPRTPPFLQDEGATAVSGLSPGSLYLELLNQEATTTPACDAGITYDKVDGSIASAHWTPAQWDAALDVRVLYHVDNMRRVVEPLPSGEEPFIETYSPSKPDEVNVWLPIHASRKKLYPEARIACWIYHTR